MNPRIKVHIYNTTPIPKAQRSLWKGGHTDWKSNREFAMRFNFLCDKSHSPKTAQA